MQLSTILFELFRVDGKQRPYFRDSTFWEDRGSERARSQMNYLQKLSKEQERRQIK